MEPNSACSVFFAWPSIFPVFSFYSLLSVSTPVFSASVSIPYSTRTRLASPAFCHLPTSSLKRPLIISFEIRSSNSCSTANKTGNRCPNRQQPDFSLRQRVQKLKKRTAFFGTVSCQHRGGHKRHFSNQRSFRDKQKLIYHS